MEIGGGEKGEGGTGREKISLLKGARITPNRDNAVIQKWKKRIKKN